MKTGYNSERMKIFKYEKETQDLKRKSTSEEPVFFLHIRTFSYR